MQLVDVDVELPDHAQDGLGDQTGPVGVEEPIQHPAHPVVVQRASVPARQAEQGGLVARGPLTQGVDRSVTHHDVAHRHADHRGGRQPQPGVPARHVGLQEPAQADPAQEVVEHRQAPHPLAGDPTSTAALWLQLGLPAARR